MSDNPRIDELRRRVQTDPASIAFAALAEEYRRAGRFEEAVATCEAGLLRHPAYVSARVTLGRALMELSRYDDARAQLEQVLRAAPENLAAIRALAEIHGRGASASDHVLEHAADSAAAAAAPAQAAESSEPEPLPAARPPAPLPVSAGSSAVIEPAAPSSVRLAVPFGARPKPAPPTPLAALESFLAAILRARDELGSGDAIR